MPIATETIIIFIAFAGFLLASYIRHKKTAQESLTCPLNFKCENVIWSKYSRFLGIPVEILGLFYYGAISVFYGLALIFPNILIEPLIIAVFLASAAAFAFSIYLTLVQAIILKEWCSWCLVSAGFCLAIFSLALYSLDFKLFF